jgi:signal transduction histidine kinase/ligand-binding sensor domain-containing protein/DNA-binding response OmpR family regulator
LKKSFAFHRILNYFMNVHRSFRTEMTSTFKRILIISLWLAAVYAPVHAQIEDLRFTHLTTDDGLSQSNVTCILQDSKGFMWFGTFNGLNRYDGYTFEVYHYQPDDSQSISHNYISALFEDRRGYLWVGTSDGLNRYDREMDHFTTFKHQPDIPASISDNQIEAICEDSKGRLWIGTRNGGLERFLPADESFRHYVHREETLFSLSSDFVRAIYEDNNGHILLAHGNGAIDIYDEETDAFRPLFPDGKKLTDARISAIIESPSGELWVGTQGDGLYMIERLLGVSPQVDHFSKQSAAGNRIGSNAVLSLFMDDSGRLWIGTEDAGINIYDTRTGEISQYRHDPFIRSSLNHDSIWSIYEDRAGNTWVGTYAHGINLLMRRKSSFHHYKHHPGSDNSLSHNMVNAFSEDRNRHLWIATDGGGVTYFDRNTGRFTHYNSGNSNLGSDVIVSLFEDGRGRLWLGTWADGLYRFDRTSGRFTRFTTKTHGLGSDRILHITGDLAGGLWLSTFWGGLTRFSIEDGSATVYNKNNSGLSDNDVRATMQDYLGNLWIGTDVGVDLYNPRADTFINYRHNANEPGSISKGFVHTIIQSMDSTIWIGTTGGLNRFDPHEQVFEHYNTTSGLPDDEIKCIIEDTGAVLWLSTNRGISRFDVEQGTFRNYDVTDGLQGNDFNTRSGIQTSRGEILFGGNNGFNIFDPGEISENSYIPPVVITDFRIFNVRVPVGVEDSPLSTHISETRQLVLSHRDAVFSFEFAALNYISPEKNQYAYMMEGFETDWNYVKSSRTVTYTNLDPGDYVFRVKASNNDGLWNEEGVSLDLKITPSFWKTGWAYLLEVLLGLGIIYFVANYFISRRRLRKAMDLEHLEMERMYDLDRMKTQFFNNIAHEFNSPLTLILSPLEKLVSSEGIDANLRNSLKIIHGNARRLQRMIGQLKDVQKLETDDLHLSLSRGNIVQFIENIARSFNDHARDRKILYRLDTEKESLVAWFDQDKLDKIIYNLLSNAFKFTPDGGEIVVKLSITASKCLREFGAHKRVPVECVEISVKDSGIGIPDDKIEHIFQRYYQIDHDDGREFEGSGIGLALVYELVKLYGGDILVSGEEGQGATFTVQIPIDEQYLEENQLVGDFNVFPALKTSLIDEAADDSEIFDGSVISKNAIPVKDIPIILAVDDDPEIRDYIIHSLESRYRMFGAENGQDGFEKAVKIIPDLIISDVRMPGVSGTELSKMLREDEKTSHIPIILLTAYSDKEYKIEGLTTGADAYLTKPFSIDILEAQISNLLESRKKLRIKFSRKIYLEPRDVDIEDVDAQFLRQVIETIEKHMSDSNFNAVMLSRKVGMSRMQLYRKLRMLTNQTVHEFIRSIRLKRAVQLLEQKNKTITEVAFEVGFNDLTYFARCFRKQYQKSPSEYISR